jgi:hypothetical protein
MQWKPRPGERGYYVYPLVSLCLLTPLLFRTGPFALAAALTAIMVGAVLYRFLRYPPRRHSEVLSIRRHQRLHAVQDVRRPD